MGRFFRYYHPQRINVFSRVYQSVSLSVYSQGGGPTCLNLYTWGPLGDPSTASLSKHVDPLALPSKHVGLFQVVLDNKSFAYIF